jgi:hypothetical protein
MHPWSDGWRRVLAAPHAVVGVLMLTLVAALPLALTLRDDLRDHLGSSLEANQAADGVNYDWWQEFNLQATGIATTFTPSVIGFATTLDAMTALLDRRRISTPIAAALLLYLLAWLFVSGGILDRYARGRSIGGYGFFAASGMFFLRFLRLAVAMAFVYWLLFAYVHSWLFERWYVNLTRDVAVERTALSWRLLMYAIFIGLLALTTVVFDYAKVRAVVEDRRSMTGALVASIRFIVRHPGRVLAVYLLNALLFVFVVGTWALMAPGAGGSGLSMWMGVAASQGYILARLVAKLQVMASEIAVFQQSLAHWGYTATAAAQQQPPPLLESA